MIKFTEIPTEKKEKYFTVSVYCLIFVTLMSLFVLLLRNISNITSGIASILLSISSVLYGCIFALAISRLQKLAEGYILPFFSKIFAKPAGLIKRKFTKNGKTKPENTTKEKNAEKNKIISLIIAYVIVIVIVAVYILSVIPAVASSYNEIKDSLSGFLYSAQSFADSLTDILPEIDLSFLIKRDKANAPVIIGEDGKLKNVIFTTVREASQSELFASLQEMQHKELVFSVGKVVNSMIVGSYKLLSQITPSLLSFMVSMFNQTKNVIIGLIISVYLLGAKERLYGGAQRILHKLFDDGKVKRINADCAFVDEHFMGFVCNRMTHSLVIGLMYFIVLRIAGLRFAALIGVIMSVTALVPYIGVLIGILIGAFVAILTGGTSLLIFLISATVIQVIDYRMIEKVFLRYRTNLDSVWIMIAVTVMGGFMGVIGMLIAVPVFESIGEILKKYVAKKNTNS